MLLRCSEMTIAYQVLMWMGLQVHIFMAFPPLFVGQSHFYTSSNGNWVFKKFSTAISSSNFLQFISIGTSLHPLKLMQEDAQQ